MPPKRFNLFRNRKKPFANFPKPFANRNGKPFRPIANFIRNRPKPLLNSLRNAGERWGDQLNGGNDTPSGGGLSDDGGFFDGDGQVDPLEVILPALILTGLVIGGVIIYQKTKQSPAELPKQIYSGSRLQ